MRQMAPISPARVSTASSAQGASPSQYVSHPPRPAEHFVCIPIVAYTSILFFAHLVQVKPSDACFCQTGHRYSIFNAPFPSFLVIDDDVNFFLICFEACQAIDICFILDTSISVDSDEWAQEQQFLDDLLTAFTDVGPNDVQVGFVIYSHVAEVAANLNRCVGGFAVITIL